MSVPARVFGVVPVEVPVERRLSIIAPAMARAVVDLLAHVVDLNAHAFETLRSEARQQYLYGFGRQYDDGRGIVTRASSALTSWHGYGLAVDLVQKDNTPWEAPDAFWDQLGHAAAMAGLEWGGLWQHPDRPHVQWGLCPTSPTEADHTLAMTGGLDAVWAKYGATP